MEKELGLYVSVSGDGNLKRTLVSVSGEVELEATTLNDEVILFSELNYSCYAFIVDRIKLAFQFLLTRDKDVRVRLICAYLSLSKIPFRI